MKDIQNIWQFFENLNEYVYATEIETNELVYMNRKTLDALGFHSVDDIQGKNIVEAMEKVNSLEKELLEEHEHHHDGECGCGHHHDHHHHHADDVFTSWGRETPHKYTKEGIEDILKKFCDTEEYGTILRAKGMVPAEDGTWIYFDMVPGEYEIREGEPDYTGRLCVIGTDIEEHQLEHLFELV